MAPAVSSTQKIQCQPHICVSLNLKSELTPVYLISFHNLDTFEDYKLVIFENALQVGFVW